MQSRMVHPTTTGEARLLLLIDAFSKTGRGIEGRTKLAKLDFLFRYPSFLQRAIIARGLSSANGVSLIDEGAIEIRMIRYRYGPWDPTYFGLLGRLIGKGLIISIPGKQGAVYVTTKAGSQAASMLIKTSEWEPLASNARLLKTHFDFSGGFLKSFIYKHFPEVTQANWRDEI